MIEVVAIDNRNAEAELLRLAAEFATQRLLQPKQQKRLMSVIEVTGEGAPRPTARAQLAQKQGMFQSAHYHFDCAISLAHGFEMAVLQMMHECVHHAQVINHRYQLAAKTIKKEGQKQVVFQARWLGKKQGMIDDTPWQDRPWEQEASQMGEQLAAEFMALLHGTQSEFAAMGQKKELRLYDVSLALPMMAPPSAPQAPMPEIAMPEVAMPEMGMPEMAMPEVGLPEVAMPEMTAESSPKPDDDIFGDIDALISAELGQNPPPDISPARSTEAGFDDNRLADEIGADSFFDAPSFDAPQFDAPDASSAPIADNPIAPDEERLTYVSGIAEPRHLKLSVLEAKRRELSERGLLENSAK